MIENDFIEPLRLRRYRVAKAMGVPQRRVDEICAGARLRSVDGWNSSATKVRAAALWGCRPLS